MKPRAPLELALVSSAVAAVLAGAAQSSSTRPPFEDLIGPWEVAAESAIDGIFVSILTATAAERAPVRETHVGLYHRSGGDETWAWFVADDRKNEYLSFDGQHLTLRARGRIDVAFDVLQTRWIGTWDRDGLTKDVVLERPRRPRGAPANEFCGAWDEMDAGARPQVAGHVQPPNRLHVAESGDRHLTAWMDRPFVVGGRQHGERFRVIAAAGRSLDIEWVHSVGPGVRFTAHVSDDGAVMVGRWIRGAGGRVGTMGPTTLYRRAQTCV